MSLADRIYSAQCYGNVEPIEHMVPYPNLPALVEGETIKFSKRQLFPETGLTNGMFYTKVQQAAHWLKSLEIKPFDRIYFENFPTRDFRILVYATWYLGASVVLCEGNDSNRLIPDNIKMSLNANELEFETLLIAFPEKYNPTFRASLMDEACLVALPGCQIRLSHYQCLVNANGVSRGLNIHDHMTYYTRLLPGTLTWLICEALIPFFTGSVFSPDSPTLTIGYADKDEDSTYILTSQWKNTFKSNDCFVLPEAGGILLAGEKPIHLMNVLYKDHVLTINGHGVMMGYTDDVLNDKVFKENKLIISL